MITNPRTSTRLKFYWLLHRLTSSYWLCFQCWMKHILEHRDIQHGDVWQCREGKHGYFVMTDPRTSREKPRRMICAVCGKGPQDGVNIYRSNETGVTGIWRCSKHPSVESFINEHDQDGIAIERALEGK